MIHKLKIESKYFEEVHTGKKSFEIRKNDRNFQVGDILILKEYKPEVQEFTGEFLKRKVTYITDYAQQDGFVVMAIV